MKFLDGLTPYAHWLLRLALSAVFLYHGFPKFQMLDQMAEMLHMPYFVAVLVALAEIGGPAFILVGGVWKDWMTRLGGAMIAIVMIGAIVLVHGANGFDMSKGGAEYNIVLLAIALYMVIKGNHMNHAGKK